MKIQWSIIVDVDDTNEELIKMLNDKTSQAVSIARDEYPTNEIKFGILEFEEVEL